MIEVTIDPKWTQRCDVLLNECEADPRNPEKRERLRSFCAERLPSTSRLIAPTEQPEDANALVV